MVRVHGKRGGTDDKLIPADQQRIEIRQAMDAIRQATEGEE